MNENLFGSLMEISETCKKHRDGVVCLKTCPFADVEGNRCKLQSRPFDWQLTTETKYVFNTGGVRCIDSVK